MTIAEKKQRVLEQNYLLMFFEEAERLALFWEWSRSEKTSSTKLNSKVSLATFNVGLLAARKIDDFFDGSGKKGRNTDIRADRFGPFPLMSGILTKEIRNEINWHLAHITQQGENLRFKTINIDMIAHPIWERCEQFCLFLLSDYVDLNNRLDAPITQEIESFLAAVKIHRLRTRAA